MATSEKTKRLHFLDGLRGFAALYVLLFHETTAKGIDESALSRGTRFFRACVHEGHFAVVVFIVLSGFSLMLPVARSGEARLVGTFADYLRRRARRILPPYYAALVFALGLLVAYNALAVRFHLGKPIDDAATSTGSILSHLLLLHNLNFDWAYRINGPAWSVATEWQIYFFFVLLLLPLLRKVGPIATMLSAWVLGCLPFVLLPPNENFFWACPWFLGSFALGMWGALIAFSPVHAASWFRTRAPWEWITFALFAGIALLSATGRTDRWAYPIVNAWVSLLAFSFINLCATRSARGRGQGLLLLRVFESAALVELGAFSYSLYLVQHPILRLTERVFVRLPLGADGLVAVHLLLGTALVSGFAWLFSEFFERPFTGGGVVLPALKRRFSSMRRVGAPPA